MKKLFYIGSPQLGETLFATPALEFLSKEYEIYLLVSERVSPVFEGYSFIKKIITCEENWRIKFFNIDIVPSTLQQLKECFGNDPTDVFYAYHNDNDPAMIKNNAYFKNFKSLYVKKCDSYLLSLSRSRKYMVKLGLMQEDQLDNFDCTIRSPNYIKGKSGKLIIYQGSKEPIRRLPDSVIELFTKIVPDATFMVEYEVANNLKLKQRGFDVVYTKPYHTHNMRSILALLESDPKAIICPDAGCTQLALRYKIPMIWLETRVKASIIIDKQAMNGVKIYRKESPICDCDCDNRKATTSWNNLRCRLNTEGPCLTYTEEEVKYIISLVSEEWLSSLKFV